MSRIICMRLLVMPAQAGTHERAGRQARQSGADRSTLCRIRPLVGARLRGHDEKAHADDP
jgi:hypothetical protein